MRVRVCAYVSVGGEGEGGVSIDQRRTCWSGKGVFVLNEMGRTEGGRAGHELSREFVIKGAGVRQGFEVAGV